MMERITINTVLTVGKKHNASRKAAGSGEETRVKMRRRDTEELLRKAMGKRPPANGMSGRQIGGICKPLFDSGEPN